MPAPDDVTGLLDDWSRGDRRAGHTLQPTALVHEAYLRLVEQRNIGWQSRAHFFGVPAQAMCRILVDDARRHGAKKSGDGAKQVTLAEIPGSTAGTETSIIAVDRALARLEQLDPAFARIVSRGLLAV